MTGSDIFDRITVWLDKHQQELDKLRRHDDAMELREVAHRLSLYRLRVYGSVAASLVTP